MEWVVEEREYNTNNSFMISGRNEDCRHFPLFFSWYVPYAYIYINCNLFFPFFILIIHIGCIGDGLLYQVQGVDSQDGMMTDLKGSDHHPGCGPDETLSLPFLGGEYTLICLKKCGIFLLWSSRSQTLLHVWITWGILLIYRFCFSKSGVGSKILHSPFPRWFYTAGPWTTYWIEKHVII